MGARRNPLTVKQSKEFEKFRKRYPNYEEKIKTLIKALKENTEIGKQYEYRRIPKPYLKRGFTNVWCARIDQNFRMVYTYIDTIEECYAHIIEALDHSDYDRLFKK